VASIAAHADASIHALTVRDPATPRADESEVAGAIAHRLGIAHTVVDVSGREAAELASESAGRLDQPSVDGVNTFIISHAANQAGFKVALSGVGGDELFGGYRPAQHFRRLALLGRTVGPAAPLVRRELERMDWSRGTRRGRATWLFTHGAAAYGPYLLTRAIHAPQEVARLVGLGLDAVLHVIEERIQDPGLNTAHRNYGTALEIDQYLGPQLLRDADAASMASSLEVRTPLVDARLFEAAAACDPTSRLAGPAKRLLRSAAAHPLDDLVLGPKRGFTVPMAKWIREGTLDLCDAATSVLEPEPVRTCLTSARAGRESWSRAWVLHTLGVHVSMTARASRDPASSRPSSGTGDRSDR
jgi:asparagine synthase (glutamine-hydrolysing)